MGVTLAEMFSHALEGADGRPLFRIHAGAHAVELHDTNDVGRGLTELVAAAIEDTPHVGWIRATMTSQVPSDVFPATAEVQISAEGIDGVTNIMFSDSSRAAYAIQSPEPDDALDEGPALLLAIGVREHRGIELILGELEHAIANDELSPFDEQRILFMADVIRSTLTSSEPDTTTRWKVVGAVRGALKHLSLSLAPDLFGWWKIAEILHDIRWIDTIRDISDTLH